MTTHPISQSFARRWIYNAIILCIATQSLSQDDKAPRDAWEICSVTPFRITLSNIAYLLDPNSKANKGRWPADWDEMEALYGTKFYRTPALRDQFRGSVVLLHGIKGHINSKEEGPYDSEMVLVMARPISREVGQSTEIGRWVLWRVETGQIASRWHSEAELTAFSAWNEVESSIEKFLSKTVGASDTTEKLPSPVSPFVHGAAQSKSPAAKSTTLSTAPDASTSRVIFATAIAVALGFLWFALTRRRMNREQR